MTKQAKSAKKRRGPQKKIKIVELDDVEEEVKLLKNASHWKNHWVFQLISIRGEMHNTFSAPLKQGIVSFFVFFGGPLLLVTAINHELKFCCKIQNLVFPARSK